MAAENASEAKTSDCRLLVVGVGNGAGRAVAELARQGPDGPLLAVVNTEAAGEAVPGGRVKTIQFGAQVIKGLGTGGDPRVGRRAAAEDAETLRALFRDVNWVILVVGLGGGTGTGAAPLVAEEARKAGVLVLALAMLPFEFEGRRRMEHARQGLLALQEAADGVICLPNQRLLELVEDRANLAQAFQQADTMVARGVCSLWRVLCRKGVIHLDFSAVRTLLREGGGPCVFGCAEGEGPDRINQVLRALGSDPLLKRGQTLAQASSYLVSISGGEDLTLKEVDALARGVAAAAKEDALAMVGVSCDPALRERVLVTVLAVEPGGDRPARPAPAEAAPPSAAPSGSELTQGNLFETAGQGRFKDVDPTIIEGDNLDIPTFIRRRIMIQKVRDNRF